METISTFEQIPGALNILLAKIDCLSKEVSEIKEYAEGKAPAGSEVMDIDEVCKLTKKTKWTIYKLSSQRLIPCSKKGQKLYFKRSEIIRWIENGQKVTLEEIDGNAREYIARRALNK